MNTILNFDFETMVLELIKKAENMYIDECTNLNRQYEPDIPSLENVIENTVTHYLEDNFKGLLENNIEEFNRLHSSLFERVSNELNQEDVLENLKPIPFDYWGLSEYERNCGRY